MKFKSFLSILISLTLFSCYSYRETRRYCHCQTSSKDLSSDSIHLDSLKLYYLYGHVMSESGYSSDSELIKYAITKKKVLTSSDTKILNKLDSNIRNIDLVSNELYNQGITCSKSSKRTNLFITEVYVLYYSFKGIKKEIFISYNLVSILASDKIFYVMGSPKNRYKCPVLLGSLIDVFHPIDIKP